MKKTRILTRLYGVIPTIVLRRKLIKARHIILQHYGVTTRNVYTVTLLLWKAESSESALQCNMDTKRLHCKMERTMAGVDINTLTMKQYLALSRENHTPDVVKPEIRGNVNFEIKSQFMRELKKDTFSKNKNKDAHDHVGRVFNIVSLFNIPEVSQDVVILRVFPFTLTGSAKRWVDRLTLGAVNTWDLLKKSFVHHPRLLNDLKTSTTSSRKVMNYYTCNNPSFMTRMAIASPTS
nr:hypothetical protein [Tanacetum cinerariifolium]